MKRVSILMLVVTGMLFLASPLFAGETKAGGEVFVNWNLHLNDHGMVKNYHAFELTQAYIDIKHKFDEKYSARVTADIFNNGGDSDGWEFRGEMAYLQINRILPRIDLRFGLQPLIWAEKVDQAWGLRYVDIASMEGMDYLAYSDFGVSFLGTYPGNWGTVALQIVNGGGKYESEQNKYKDIILFSSLNPLKKNPNFKESAIWAQYYYGFPNLTPVPGLSFSDLTQKDRFSVAGLVKYRQWFTTYIDYFMATDDENLYATEDTTITGYSLPEKEKSTGITIFTKVNVATSETFLSNVYMFGKLEFIDKHRDHTAAGLEHYADENDSKFLTVGVGYKLIEGVHMAIVVDRSTVNRIEFDEEAKPLRIAETEKNTFKINFLGSF